MRLLPKTGYVTRIEHDDGSVSEVTDMLAACIAAASAQASVPSLSAAMKAEQRRRARTRGPK